MLAGMISWVRLGAVVEISVEMARRRKLAMLFRRTRFALNVAIYWGGSLECIVSAALEAR